jgi:hypothetical protein
MTQAELERQIRLGLIEIDLVGYDDERYGRDRKFLMDMAVYAKNAMISEAQAKWISDIGNRIDEARTGAAAVTSMPDAVTVPDTAGLVGMYFVCPPNDPRIPEYNANWGRVLSREGTRNYLVRYATAEAGIDDTRGLIKLVPAGAMRDWYFQDREVMNQILREGYHQMQREGCHPMQRVPMEAEPEEPPLTRGKVVRRLLDQGVEMWVNLKTVDGDERYCLRSVEQVLWYMMNPVNYAARHFGLDIASYEEWLACDGVPLCSATTGTGDLCRNSIVRKSYPAREWRNLHRNGKCWQHSRRERVLLEDDRDVFRAFAG